MDSIEEMPVIKVSELNKVGCKCEYRDKLKNNWARICKQVVI